MGLSVSDFAARIKAKYPVYAGLDDSELTASVVAKHPEYATAVDMDPQTSIAYRKLAPPAAATGDPRAKPESALEQIMPAAAHPLDAAGGFLSAINPLPALADPVGAIKGDAKTRAQEFSAIHPSTGITDPQAGENLRHLFAALVPFLGPALAGAGRQMESPNAETRARGFGGAVGSTAGPSAVSDLVASAPAAVGGFLEEHAPVTAAKIFGSKANPIDAAKAAQTMIDNNIIAKSKDSLARQAEQGAAESGTELTAAVNNMQPIDIGRVQRPLAAERGKMYNPKTGAPITPEAEATAKKIDSYERTHINDNVSAVPSSVGPQFVLDPDVALKLKQEFDKKPGQRGVYGQNAPDPVPSDIAARAAIANSLRDAINSDPAARAANVKISDWLRLKGLSEKATPFWKDALAQTATGAAMAGPVMYFLPGLGKMIAGAKLANIVASHPLFRSMSAGAQDALGKALQTGDAAAIGDVTGKVLGGAGLADSYGHDDAVHDLVNESYHAAGDDSAMARQLMHNKKAVYVNPDGSIVEVPNAISQAFYNSIH